MTFGRLLMIECCTLMVFWALLAFGGCGSFLHRGSQSRKLSDVGLFVLLIFCVIRFQTTPPFYALMGRGFLVMAGGKEEALNMSDRPTTNRYTQTNR